MLTYNTIEIVLGVVTGFFNSNYPVPGSILLKKDVFTIEKRRVRFKKLPEIFSWTKNPKDLLRDQFFRSMTENFEICRGLCEFPCPLFNCRP